MKKLNYFLFFVLLFLGLESAAITEQKIKFLGRWDDNSIDSIPNQTYNSCWGYTAKDGKEYGILGSVGGIYFLELPEKGNPILRASFDLSKIGLCVHREFQVKDHYAFAVADENPSSLLIFDLQYLPDSVVKVYDSDQFFEKSHDITVSGNILYCSWTKKFLKNNALTAIDITDPEKPSLIKNYSNSSSAAFADFEYVHESTFRNDTGYLSCGDAGLNIVDFKDKSNPKLIGSIKKYQDNGYNHSSILSPNGNYLYFTDENRGSRQKVFDLTNFRKSSSGLPTFVKVFGINDLADSIVPHNQYIVGNVMYVSYYREGVACFDVTNPRRPELIDQYDTYPQYNSGVYNGCWQVFPYFKSGRFIASDQSNGLFLLKLDTIVSVQDEVFIKNKLNIVSYNSTSFLIKEQFKKPIIKIYSIEGKEISFDYIKSVEGIKISLPMQRSSEFMTISVYDSGKIYHHKMILP